MCVLTVFLYGSENWIIMNSHLDRLEAFQGEVGNSKAIKVAFHQSGLQMTLDYIPNSNPET